MSPADENAKKEALARTEAARVADQALEAKLDRFIAENAQLLEHYGAMNKAELVRELMLAEMTLERAEVSVRTSRVLAQWAKENPDIVAKVEERMKNTAADHRERVFLTAAKLKMQQSQGMRASRGIRP